MLLRRSYHHMHAAGARFCWPFTSCPSAAPHCSPTSHRSCVTHAPPLPQLDLIDLGEGRDEHFRYVLVYLEMLTRTVWLRALPTKEPLQVAREVRVVPCRPALQPAPAQQLSLRAGP